MQLHPPVHNINGMTRHGFDLLVEASDIGLRRFYPLYDDAIDVGVVLYNPKTGHETRWYMETEKTDGEGDILEWVCKPCSESVARYPDIGPYTLRILND